MHKSLKFLAVACLAMSTIGAQAERRIYIGKIVKKVPRVVHTTVIRTEKRDNFWNGFFSGYFGGRSGVDRFFYDYPATALTLTAATLISLGVICATTEPRPSTSYVTVQDDTYYDEEVIIVEERREPRVQVIRY